MMELFQDMAASIANGGYFNPAYMNCMHMMQENLTISNIDAGAGIHACPRPHHYHHHHHYHELVEGMDETALLHANLTACSSAMTISPSHHDANSIGLSTNSSTASRQQVCEIMNVGSCSSASGKLIKRRSWQEALSTSTGAPLTVKSGASEISTSIKTHPNMQDRAELTSVDKILNLHHIQAGVTNHSSTDPNQLVNCSTLTNSRTTKLPLEESLIAAQKKKSIPMPTNYPYGRSFLSALSLGDEAFFKQQLPVPMEGCKDDPVKQTAVSRAHSAVFEDSEENYDPLDGLDRRCKYTEQHGFNELSVIHNKFSIYEQPNIIWGHHQEGSVVNDLSTGTPKIGSSRDRITRPSNALVDVKYKCKNIVEHDDDENVRASQDSSDQSWEANARRLLVGTNVGEAFNVDGLESKKRSLPDIAEASACYNMGHSKRAHLGPQYVREYSNPRHPIISSSSSLSLSTVIDGSTIKSNGKTSGKRNPFGPALNTNLKPRARQGTANDPQTVSARNRRERINARLKVLEELVPNGSKVDLVTMLEKAINYVKYLQLQLRVLSNDELWEANQLHDVEKVAMQHVLMSKSEEETANAASAQFTACDPSTAATSSISTSATYNSWK